VTSLSRFAPLALGAAFLAGAFFFAAPSHGADVDVDALLKLVDDANRGNSSHAVVEMSVKTKRYERSMKMENWTLGTEKSLIRILEPAKDKGVATLKVDENLWNYLPNTDRTMKVPGAMMSGAWMGSHMTNDDLVREARFSDDFKCAIASSDDTRAVISCTPNADAAVVWGKVDVTVRLDGVPLEQVFFDEDGEKIRTMSFEDIQDLNGTPTAMTMRVTPHDKPGEFTVFKFLTLEVDIEVSDRLFSLQSLKK